MAALKIIMMGTGKFAAPSFESLLRGEDRVIALYTQPDRDTGSRSTSSTRQIGRGLQEIALEHEIPIYQPGKVNELDQLEFLRSMQPDLLVVAAYGQILSRSLLGIPRFGGINVHASLLPKYRGAAPIARAIQNGESETGVTIIHMSPALDAGDMLAQQAISIDFNETSGELENKLANIGAELLKQTIQQLKAGTLQSIIQDTAQVSKAPKLQKEEGNIPWHLSAIELHNHIRAMQPWPSAYTFFVRPNKPTLRTMIYKTRPITGLNEDTLTGSLVESWKELPAGSWIRHPNYPQELWVAVGSSPRSDSTQRDVIAIEELQLAGKSKLSAGEFLRGHPYMPGYRFSKEATS